MSPEIRSARTIDEFKRQTFTLSYSFLLERGILWDYYTSLFLIAPISLPAILLSPFFFLLYIFKNYNI